MTEHLDGQSVQPDSQGSWPAKVGRFQCPHCLWRPGFSGKISELEEALKAHVAAHFYGIQGDAPVGPLTSLAGEPDPYGPYLRGPEWGQQVDLDFPSEAALSAAVLGRLSPYFHVEEQVHGTHWSGKRLRIDAALRPREPEQWARQDVAFGIEFKNVAPNGDGGMNSFTRWAAQAVDYANTQWDDYGRMVVFTCPGVLPSGMVNHKHETPNSAHVRFTEGLLGQLGVGELVLQWGIGLAFRLQGVTVWSERSGVQKGRNWPLRPKAGSR
ncbi:hypothetical protein [Streptomyces sp. NPDC057115]|uniref:hypothetical protein n=1 Tax=Streptomyces sp. NPDC057115 TaxID=3346022 RepID=UPI00362C9E75